MQSFKQFLAEQQNNPQQLAQQFYEQFLSKYQTNHVGSHNCAWATQQFIQWAQKNGIKARAIYFVWPPKEVVAKLKEDGVLKPHVSDDGESHIAPVVNNTIIDFTYKQFDNQFNDIAKITPINQWKNVYGKYGYGQNSVEVNGKAQSVLVNNFDILKNMKEIGGINTIFPSKPKAVKESKEEKRRLDPKCWKGYRKAGTKLKDGTRVNKCIKVNK
jgi:hypothetical protein